MYVRSLCSVLIWHCCLIERHRSWFGQTPNFHCTDSMSVVQEPILWVIRNVLKCACCSLTRAKSEWASHFASFNLVFSKRLNSDSEARPVCSPPHPLPMLTIISPDWIAVFSQCCQWMLMTIYSYYSSSKGAISSTVWTVAGWLWLNPRISTAHIGLYLRLLLAQQTWFQSIHSVTLCCRC